MEQSSEHSGASCQHEVEEPDDCHSCEGAETVVSEDEEEKDEEDEDSDAFDELFGSKLNKSQSTSTDSISLLNILVQQQAEAVELEAERPEVEDDRVVETGLASKEEEGDPVKGHTRRNSDTDIKSEDDGKEEEIESEQPLDLEETVHCKESESDMLTSEANGSKETSEDQSNDPETSKSGHSDTDDGIGKGKPFCKRVPTSPKETWDFSLRPVFPNGQRKSMWVEGSIYRTLIEECFHEMSNVHCQCEEKKKVSVCRLCHVVFCSTQCFKRTVQAAIGTSEDEAKKTIKTGTESSQTKEPTNSNEVAVSKCANPQKVKETMKKTNREQLGRKLNSKGNVTNEQGDHGRRQKQDWKPKKDQYMNSYSQPYAGIGFQTPILLPPQVQRNNASRQTMPPGSGSRFRNFNPSLQNPPIIPYVPNSYPAVDSNRAILHPSVTNPFCEQFPQSMINGAAGLFSRPPPSMDQGHKSDINPNYGPHPLAMADSNAMKSTNPDSEPVGNPRDLNGQGVVRYLNSQREQTEPVMLPKEHEAPVKVLRNPRPQQRPFTISNHYDQKDQEKNLHNSHNGNNSNTPQSANVWSEQLPVENHQINQNHRRSSQDQPNYSLTAESSLSESNTYYTAASEFTQTSQNRKGQNPAIAQKSRTSGAYGFDGYDGEEVTSRNRNNEGGGFPRNRIRNNDKSIFSKASYTEIPQFPVSNSTNYSNQRKYLSSTASTSTGNNIEEREIMSRNKQSQSPFRDSRESKLQHLGNESFSSTNLCEGNSLNYSASSGGRGKNKWRQQTSSILMSTLSQSSQASGSLSNSLIKNHSPKKSNKDKTLALYRILQEPDMPYGLRFPVKHIMGKTFSDFAVRTLKGLEGFKKFHPRIQDCRKVKMIFFEPGQTCMVQYRANEEGSVVEWYRGIITKFVENVGVYLVDLGVVTLVPPADVFELPEEFNMFSPYAIRFKCLNIKSDSSNADELLQYFDSLVCQTMIKIRVTHKDAFEPHKYAGHLEVLHIGKWFDVGVLLNKFQVAEMGTESDISNEEMEGKIKPLLSVKSDIPELSVHSTVPSNTNVSVVLTHVLSLNEFYVTTEELKAKRTALEKQLCSPGVTQNAIAVSSLQDLSYPLFMTIDSQTQRWIRVKVLEVSTDLKPLSAVVFKVDYGETATVPLVDLLQLPPAFHEPGCIYKCSLPVKPALKSRKNAHDTSLECVRYLSALCNSEKPVPVNLRIFLMDNINVHIVELFLENTSSGCTFSFVKKGWVTLAYSVELN